MADPIVAASGIYAITHRASGKVYVGSAVDLRNRHCGHFSALSKGKHRNSKLQRAFNKYGANAFSFDVLELVADKALLLAAEQKWIDALDAAATGYNISKIAGSRLGSKWSEASRAAQSARYTGRPLPEETRRKLSEALKGRKKTPEHLANLSAARVGVKMPKISAALRGKKKKPESVEKQRRSLTGRKQPADEIARRAASLTGSKRSDESRRKMSVAQTGKTLSDATKEKLRVANLGKKLSAETRQKISAGNKGKKMSPEAIAKRQLSRYRPGG